MNKVIRLLILSLFLLVAHNALAAITLVGTPTTAATTGAHNITISYPAGHAAGQVAYVLLLSGASETITGVHVWTTVATSAATGGFEGYLLRRVLDGSEGNSETFSSVSHEVESIEMRVYSGENQTTPEDTTPVVVFGNNTAPTVSSMFTNTNGDELVFDVVSYIANATPYSTPNGFGNGVTGSFTTQSVVGWDQLQTTSGPTGDVSITQGLSTNWMAALVAIKAQAGFVTCPSNVTNIPNVTSCWPMQQVSGTTITDSIDSNSGVISGTYTFNQTPGGIACQNSTGSGCSITTPTNYSNPQPMTLYVDFVGTSGGILQLGTSSSITAIPYYVLFLDNHGKLTFGVNNFNTNQIIQSPLPYADGNEHKAVISLGPSGMKMFVDGSLVASSGVTLASYANGYWFFGGVNPANWPLSPSLQYFNGTLITVAWWNGTQLTDYQGVQATGGLPTALTNNNYCTFSNQIASLNPSTRQAFANQKLTFQVKQLQLPGLANSLPIGPSTIQCKTNDFGSILPGCQIPQGAHISLSVGNGPPIPLVIPASTSCDLTAIMLSQTDPPEVVSAVATSGPLFSGVTVTNPPAGTIGTATITSPNEFTQTQASAATVDVGTNGNEQQVVMTGDVSIALTNFQSGAVFSIDTAQDATGGHTPTFTVPAGWTLTWPNNTSQPTILSVLPSSHNIWSFRALSSTVLFGTQQPGGNGPSTGTLNFNNYSGSNIGGLNLVKQSPPSSVAVTATCTGTCATTYTYEVTCVNDMGQETNPSTAVTATNSNPLTTSNIDVLNWAGQPACYGGFNIYGRTGGSLSRLASVAGGVNTWTDDGTATSANSYTLRFSSAAYPVVAIWDLRATMTIPQGPVDVVSSNTGASTSAPKTTSITTTANHDIQIIGYSWDAGGGTITPPGGFSNTISVGPASGANYGFWGGEKDIAAAGATGGSTAALASPANWTALNMSIFAANPSVAVTVVSTDNHTAPAPYTTMTFGDPASTTSGDLEVICVTFKQGTNIQTPSSFQLFATGFPGTFTSRENCYLNAPGSNIPPPTDNLTGSITQALPNGQVYNIKDVGLQTFSANNGGLPNGTGGAIINQITFPVAMTVVSCAEAWANYSGCSPFPTFALKDTTAGVVLCSTGTINNSAASGAVTPSNYSLPANDVLAYLATATASGCSTTGVVSMSMVLHQ